MRDDNPDLRFCVRRGLVGDDGLAVARQGARGVHINYLTRILFLLEFNFHVIIISDFDISIFDPPGRPVKVLQV